MARTRYLDKIVNGKQYATLVEAINAGAIKNMHTQFVSTRQSLLIMGMDFDDKALAQAMYITARQAIVEVVQRQMDKGNVFPDVRLDDSEV